MKVLTIPCPKCKGGGSIPLSRELLEVVDMIKAEGKLSATEVYAFLGNNFITITAINQRLEDLRKLGFLDREREGKSFQYFIAKK